MIQKKKKRKACLWNRKNILNEISDKDLLSKVYKELIHHNTKKIIQLLNEQRT